MSKIAAAVFADQASADDAMDALSGLGVGPPDVETFVLNGPGRHGQLPMGGDEDADSDARQVIAARCAAQRSGALWVWWPARCPSR